MSTITYNNLNTGVKPTWCPGCGDFGIWMAFKQAAELKGWNNYNTVLTAGIGCHGHILNYTKITAFEGLHGRDLPLACGAKMANPNINVFVFAGDGDCLAEGGNHFIHTAKRNHDITLILHDNAIYGLTTGQTSPRSPKGFKSKSTPIGNFEEPFNPCALAIAAGATFVARVYAGHIDELAKLLVEANNHKGFAFIDVLQPCVTFNSLYTHSFYQNNTYDVTKLPNSENAKFFTTNRAKAYEKALEWGVNKIPVGVIYKVKQPTYEEQITQLQGKSVVNPNLETRNIESLLNSFF